MNNITTVKDSAYTVDSERSYHLGKSMGVTIDRCCTTKEVRKVIWRILEQNSDLLPESKSSLILLKPNLNSDMSGLTGNTTDLRILSAIATFLKDKGYTSVVIGDGTSTGFINAGINVISRLRIDSLAEKFGFRALDLNKAPSEKVKLDGETEVKIARICFDSELFVNLPKIKTHAEARVSACLKNMMGCVVGIDKQKIHCNLYENIIKLNKVLRPDIHIVDGLVAMEGTGPSRGNPVKMGLIISGKDPLLVDCVCTRLMGFNLEDVPYLKMFESMRHVISLQNIVDATVLDGLSRKFENPEFSLASFINAPRYRRFFVRLRYQRALFNFFSTDLVSKLLYFIKARQDRFIKKDSAITKVFIKKEKCVDCKLCLDYCPMNINTYDEIGKDGKCLRCLYCFFVCPKNAILFEGASGYLTYQIANYTKLIQTCVAKQTDFVNDAS